MFAHIRSETEHVTDVTHKVERYDQMICKTASSPLHFSSVGSLSFTTRLFTLSLGRFSVKVNQFEGDEHFKSRFIRVTNLALTRLSLP